MTAVLRNIARMRTGTLGAGSISVSTADVGFLTFAEAGVTDGDEVSYGVEEGSQREVGRGTYNAGILTRGVLKSTNSGNPIVLKGRAVVFVTALAEDIAIVLDEDDFASNSATAVPSQQSTKAYIAEQVLIDSFDDATTPITYKSLIATGEDGGSNVKRTADDVTGIGGQLTMKGRTHAASSDIPWNIKRVFRIAYDDGDTAGSAYDRRITKADLDVLISASLPTSAWYRSVDRNLPDSTDVDDIDGVQGGYWIIDESRPTAEMVDGSATDLVSYLNTDLVAMPYLTKVRDGWSLLDWIDPNKHAAIIDRTTTWSATTRLQAAAASGEDIQSPRGKFITEDKIQLLNGRVWKGADRLRSTIYAPSSFNLAASSVLDVGSAEPGASILDLSIEFYQDPAAADRGDLIQYPAAIGGEGIPRSRLDNIRIIRAYDGLDLSGNAGGARIGRMEIGAFNRGFLIDGPLDFVRIDSLHLWPFGMESGATPLGAIYRDRDTIAGEIGLVETLSLGALQIFRGKLNFLPSAAASLGVRMINHLQMDGDAANVNFDGGRLVIDNYYSTKTSGETETTLTVVSGSCRIGRVEILGSQSASAILQTGGRLQIDSGYINSNKLDQSAIEQTGGRLMLNGIELAPATGVHTKAYVKQSGSAILTMHGCRAERGSSTGTLVEIGTDSIFNHISENHFDTWDYVLPSGAHSGSYGPNRSPKRAFTPSLTFATPGDYSPSYDQQAGNYWHETNGIRGELRMQIDMNAFTTASGQARVLLTGLPATVGLSGKPVSIGIVSKVDFSAGYTQVIGTLSSSGYIVLSQVGDNVAMIDLSPTNLKASVTDILISIEFFIPTN